MGQYYNQSSLPRLVRNLELVAKLLICGHTRIVGKGGLYSQTLFIYKYETLPGFIKEVSGGCFVLINK